MTWDLSTDVVIVGFGAAGAAAGLEAIEAGAEVLAIDRFNGGGSTELSGGVIYAGGGTTIQQQAGVTDSPDAMYAYLSREVRDAVRPETLRRFVDSSPALIDWLMGHGVPFDASLCPYKTSYPNNKYYLYYSGSECSGEFRAVTPPVQRGHRVKGKGTSGKKLYQPLARSARAAGVSLRPHTRATKLITDDEGRVIGVEALSLAHAPANVRRRFARLAGFAAKPGIYYPPMRKQLERRLDRLERTYAQVVRIEARSGVIICAGGFIANREMIEHYAPKYRGGLALGTTADDGSGIALAQEVGAVTDRMENVSAWRFITPPSAFLGALLIDDKGARIIDESRYGAAVGHAMVADHGGKGWILADSDLMGEARRQLVVQSIWFQRMQGEALLRTGATRGTTLAEVARKAGIDPAGLRATVEAHNHAIDVGDPDPMGKPDEFTRPVRTGPFTLLEVSIRRSTLNPCPMLTLGGLVVDEDTGAVKSTAGKDIPGLYAAGRTAVGICSESYVSGLSLADCMFAGRRAGAHAATRKVIA